MELQELLGDKVVLLVDDVPSARRILSKFLEKGAGLTKIEQVSNGKEALDRINQGDIGLIISDWDMPQMNGIELLRAVREQGMDRHNLPFLMITSKSDEDVVIEAAHLGVSDYLLKPFSQNDLIDKVTSIFRQS